MKKIFLLSFTILLLFAGCSVTEEEEQKLVAVPYTDEELAAGLETLADIDTSVDYDLTAMSATMIYAQVYNVMTAPSDYVGKSFKISGTYEEYADGELKAIVIYDALACCAQGLEIRFPENITPPEPGENILIKGVADVFEYDGVEYCYIQLEELTILP